MPSDDSAPRSANPLAAFSPADLEQLRQCGNRRDFKDGELIVQQGGHNASLFIVERGTLHAYRESTGRRIFLGHIEPGSVFGEISLLDPGPTTATVAATSTGELLELRAEDLRKFAGLCPAAATEFLLGLLRQMARRLRHTDERLMDAVAWGGLRK